MIITPPFDQPLFRQALGRFATGVAVVSARTPDGMPIGLTVSSFNSVSLDPPLVLFSLGRGTTNFGAWQTVLHFAVNVLGEDQRPVADRFARRGTDKWDGLATLEGRHGVPLLPGAIAVFQCESYARYDGGDHEIYVGRVVELGVGPEAARPLLFYAGKYRELDGASVADAPELNIGASVRVTLPAK